MSSELLRNTIPPVTVLALPDEEGRRRRIALHGRCFYTLDSRAGRSFDAERDADASTRLHIPHADSTSTRAWVRFPHLGNWDPRYLGYESLWALLMNYPFERTLGGVPVVRHTASFQRLTICRTIPLLGIEHTVTVASGTRDGALALLTDWMHDRMTDLWEGHLVALPLRVDPALFFSELQAELGGADRVEFAFTDTGQLRRPVRWVVTLSGSPRHDRPALIRREFYADDDDLAAAAVADFTRALAGPGPHWQ